MPPRSPVSVTPTNQLYVTASAEKTDITDLQTKDKTLDKFIACTESSSVSTVTVAVILIVLIVAVAWVRIERIKNSK